MTSGCVFLRFFHSLRHVVTSFVFYSWNSHYLGETDCQRALFATRGLATIPSKRYSSYLDAIKWILHIRPSQLKFTDDNGSQKSVIFVFGDSNCWLLLFPLRFLPDRGKIPRMKMKNLATCNVVVAAENFGGSKAS
ncbi:hypothetical protein OUZ56_015871 [Daphnia magna]|uniref:Uncharacterized protein n=1 Tax=Daphnia magna TaxID=35525 RepID=A0ABR0AP71_9CRUS|nr:hypothetical protein OUZ56_015871 [Daphnia magna]